MLVEDILLENQQLTQADLDAVERFADKIFAKVGIDVEFTNHFIDRVNDARNNKPITSAELIRIFKLTYRKHGKQIPKLGDEAQAVLRDGQTSINIPFVLKWNEKDQDFQLVSKTVIRKKDFKTSNKQLTV
ncbi:MAG: hypothetical protein DRJ15_12590 [Bacteroidetes bacterium]|nr:MAG: hypothetical protein DRJ15_12590 [Bacteroidota bacterium]